MSVAIGASATGARAYTATASQGLLYMAEALFNASGSRPADRDDGRQPRDRRADQHLERPQRLDGAARLRLGPALRDRQPGGRRPARAGLPARRALLAAGDGVHGRVRPDPRRSSRSRSPSRRRSTSSCRRSCRARCSTRTSPVTIGAMVGPEAFTEVRYLAHAKQMRSARRDPGPGGASSTSASAAARAGCSTAYRCEDAETVDRRARVGPRDRCRRSSTSGASRATRIGALAIKSFRPFPLEELRAALAGARRVIVLERAFAVGVGGIVSADVRAALAGRDARSRTVIAGLGGRAITRRSLHALLDDARGGRPGAAALPRPRRRRRRARAHARPRAAAARDPMPRTSCASSGSSPRGRYERHALLPDGHLRGRQPAARTRGRVRAVRPRARERDHQGPPCLPGLRRGARRPLRARCGPARHRRPR